MSTLSQIARTIGQAGRVQMHVEGVSPSTLHFFVGFLAQGINRNIVILARNARRAEQLACELSQLMGSGYFEGAELLEMPYLSPYIDVSVDARRMISMMGTLGRLATDRPSKVLVIPPLMAVVRLPPAEMIKRNARRIEVGRNVDREEILSFLSRSGYARVTSVVEAGTFAVRGSLLDLFSPGEPWPVRVDFFGDVVESISTFDPTTQMSRTRIDSTNVLPATEAVDLSAAFGRASKGLFELADELDFPTARLAEILDTLKNGVIPPGASAWGPLLWGEGFGNPASSTQDPVAGEGTLQQDSNSMGPFRTPGFPHGSGLLEYLDPTRWIVLFDDQAEVWGAVESMLETEHKRWRSARELGRLVLPPEKLFSTRRELEEKLKEFTRVNVGALDATANLRASVELRPAVSESPLGTSRLDVFIPALKRFVSLGYRVALTASNARERDRLAQMLRSRGMPCRVEGHFDFPSFLKAPRFPGVTFYTSWLEKGTDCPDVGVLVATARELFGKAAGPFPKARSKGVPDLAPALRHGGASREDQEHLLDLSEGDFVVHRDYGIGRFLGMERRVLASGEYVCLKIEYANHEFLYVPVHNSYMVQRYIGSGKGTPKLDRMSSALWAAKVARARAGARKLAFDLLKVYAMRKATQGHAFSPSDDYFKEFEASFPYDETPDQAKAVEEVLSDMEKPHPMDRLVCGDVGFGKTEVAVRAAFKAVLDGRQVAVLVPTTVLAEQHRVTFQSRLSNYPVSIESLSRFKSKTEQTKLLKRLAEGRLDVVIGTHRLLSSDVKFKSLGLLVVDEEHRFGVEHKEKLKALRTSVDVLSMTATPIPRTLYMAMGGIRDLSLIKTPPAGRLDIRTTLTHFDPDVISEAIRFELNREGQIFFLHNRVKDIERIQKLLVELVPGLRVLIAHGQMKGRKLENTMISFINREADLLLCTTIIESGLDMPSVNTLIVNNAHQFGLAQLYQIRGRIGRSSIPAHAIFIVPPVESISARARSRLATLAKFTTVGSGFKVASIDLELRGAGNILGPEQSGHVTAVGLDMYVHLLHEEVERLKKDKAHPIVECTVDVPANVTIPEGYIPDRHQRLVFYRMIASSGSPAELDELSKEMCDRFGPLPPSVERLLTVASLRLKGQSLGISRIQGAGGVVKLRLDHARDTVLDAILSLIKDQPVPIKVTREENLVADFRTAGFADSLMAAERLLTLISSRVCAGTR